MPSAQRRLTESPVFWLLTLALVYAPYARGIFFEREWFYTHILTACIVLVALLTRWNNQAFSGIFWLDLPGVGLLAAYLTAALFAVNARAAITESMKITNFLLFYWLLAHGSWGERNFKLLLQGLFLSGFGVALLGIGAGFGIVHLTGGYLQGRIYSTFQYPNTLAVYLGFVYLIGLYLWLEERSQGAWVYPLAIYFVGACLIATGSRGGIGLFLLTLGLLLLWLPGKARLRYLLGLLVTLSPGFGTGALIAKYLAYGDTARGWLALVLGAGVAWGLGISQHRLVKLPKKYLAGAALGAMLLVGTIYIFSTMQGSPLQRLNLTSVQLSEFQERLTYDKDGLAMVLDRPLLGYGGGGWAMYPRYQSYPYWVSDPHNQFLKLTVESGLVGLAFYLWWWAGLIRTAWLKIRQGDIKTVILLSGLLLIGIHSLMDFDLSYGAIGLLVWSTAGMIQAEDPKPVTPSGRVQKYSILTMAAALALLLGGLSFSFLQAAEQEALSQEAGQQGRNQEAVSHLQLAQKLDPFNAQFPMELAGQYVNTGGKYNMAQAQQLADRALRLNSTDPELKGFTGRILLQQGQLRQAAALVEDRLTFQTLNEDAYIQAAQSYEQLAAEAKKQGNKELAKEFLLTASRLADRFQTRLNRVPPRETALWVTKPQVSTRLKQKCQQLAAEVKKL